MDEFERCTPWIEAALEYNGGFYALSDIRAEVESGMMQLWPAPKGCLVTQILTFPRRKVLHILLGGGELEQLADMHKSVIMWATAQGCDCATITGRAGWERAFKHIGWTPSHKTLELDFKAWAKS